MTLPFFYGAIVFLASLLLSQFTVLHIVRLQTKMINYSFFLKFDSLCFPTFFFLFLKDFWISLVSFIFHFSFFIIVLFCCGFVSLGMNRVECGDDQVYSVWTLKPNLLFLLLYSRAPPSFDFQLSRLFRFDRTAVCTLRSTSSKRKWERSGYSRKKKGNLALIERTCTSCGVGETTKEDSLREKSNHRIYLEKLLSLSRGPVVPWWTVLAHFYLYIFSYIAY